MRQNYGVMSSGENTQVAECVRRARRDDRASRSEGVCAASTRTPSRSHLDRRGRGAHGGEGGLIVSRPNLEAAKRASPELADRHRQVFAARVGRPWGLDLSVGADGCFVGVTVSVASADLGLAPAIAISAAWTFVVLPGKVNKTVTVSCRTTAMRKGAPAGDCARTEIGYATQIAEFATRMARAA